MRHLILATAIATTIFWAGPGQAQAPDGLANRTGIDKLNFMVGRWNGEGWMMRGSEDKMQTTISETVERKLNGAVLLVEGLGVIPGKDGGQPRTVHNALGVISFDPKTGAYTLRSYIATGQHGDFVLTPIEGGVKWSREVPGGQIRNTARISKDEWHEIGEFSRDGKAWSQIMEMRLRRVP